MISLDTFTGVAAGLIDEQHSGTITDEDTRRSVAPRSRRSSRRRSKRTASEDSIKYARLADGTDDDMSDSSMDLNDRTRVAVPRNGDSRMHHLFELLSLKNHTGDAKQALVQRVLGVINVNELVLSKATEEQIASAANDALTDEILATVDMEDKRRKSVAAESAESMQRDAAAAMAENAALLIADDDSHGSYRVLELVDVLDATSGGMVKRILTNVRRRPTGTQPASRKTEFCGFCVDYRGHATAQHRCRVCGALGEHRSQVCTQLKQPKSGTSTPRSRRRSGAQTPQTPTNRLPQSSSNTSLASMDTPSSDVSSRLTPDASDKSYCNFCSTWGFHSTENHRCRICSVMGEHRSRDCTKKNSSEGYRWRGSPAEAPTERKHCDLCGTLRAHSTAEHRCRICLKLGEHRSKNCPLHTPTSDPPSPAATSQSATPPSRGRLTPRLGLGRTHHCSFCGKNAVHRSEEHICRLCRATGLHRSGDCPSRKANSVLSYSVETASKVRDRVLESIPHVLPTSASTLVMESIDKVGDVDTILRRTLQRIGVWGGGSQTPITTPYAAPAPPSRSARQSLVDASAIGTPVPPPALQNVDGSGVYVLAYAEGRSVVPERILKYMRLLMHHRISTNAFSVVVVFDPRPSTWELEKPGMITPRSLPSSPTMSEQLKKRMAKYTLQTLVGARDKLVQQVVAHKKLQMQQQQQQRHQHQHQRHETAAH